MTSPNDPQSPKDMSWLHEEPTSVGERPPGLPPPNARPAPPAAPSFAVASRGSGTDAAGQGSANRPEPPAKVRGLFGKHSLPPPPAGRGPAVAPRPLDAKPGLAAPPTIGAPELPAGVNTADDPIGDLFGDADGGAAPAAETVVMEAETEVERDDPTLVPSGNDGLFAADPPQEPRQVARLGLAKTMLASTAAEEIMAHEPTRDPRSEDSIRPDQPAARSSLEGVVFDPDQSVARHLGEVAIDGQVGPAVVSDALADLPLPQVPPAGMSSDAPIDAVPVRSMRSAMMIMALVLISGGAATLMSLGVLGSSPAEFRKKGPAARTAAAAASAIPAAPAAPVVDAPRVATAPTTAIPTVVAAVPAVMPEQKAPEPAPAAAAPAPTAEVAEPPAAAEPTAPTPVVATPDHPIEQGDALLRTGDTDSALAQYQAALTADARDHHAMEGLVKIYLARGQHRDALPYAEQIVKRRPKRAAYRILHGQALLGVGDRTGARQAFQEALALEPDNRDAQRLLSQ